MKLILASASPRRAELLAEAGYQFDIVPADVDEKQVISAAPSEFAQRLAILKTERISEQYPNDVVLGADTIVCLGERILGKPEDETHARQMLDLLSGTTQIVISGICVMRKTPEFLQCAKVMSAVRMANLTPQQIDQYLASGQWQGKAGGYGIQDDDPLVKRIAGSHTNIVGLPMEAVRKILSRAGIQPTPKT